ncbi:class I SAM-dependent methyltransferase [Alkalihalobacillus sp. LMS6]|uniref:class I SAM-dependent methyltransferase n=1 Tax=Bacillaceae TaxID=186817 RepID=UPI000C081E4B|nr:MULTISPECIES: class I SAM-dependent methyltransferase [Bacillaceae]UTR04627.1 class I SAM-dependent methyltransferase [Alkalihalobacillus sp. LMS6]
MAVNDLRKMWHARKWMKQTEPFLMTWHAHLGYSLNLFSYFKKPATVEEVASKHQLDEVLLKRWVDVGLTVGHLKKKRRNKVKSSRQMVTYLTKTSKRSVGILLEEMFELHIPTLLTYKHELPKGDHQEKTPVANMVAETSTLLEAVTLPKVASRLNKQKSKRVLDVGCGLGGYIKKLAEQFPSIQFHGIEIDQDVCQRANDENGYKNVTIEQGDFKDMPFQQPYETVMMNNILYYFTLVERIALIKKAADVLKRKGELMIITPLADGKHGRRFASAFNSFMTAHKDMNALPTKKELQYIAKQANLKIVEERALIKEGGWYLIRLKRKT